MNWSPRRSARILAACVGVALVAVACVDPGEPGVQIDAVSAELVFGVEDVEEATPEVEQSVVESIEIAAPLPVEVNVTRRTSAPPRRTTNLFTEDDFELPLIFDETPPRPTICYATIRNPAVRQPVVPQLRPAGLKNGVYVWNGSHTVGPADKPVEVTGLAPQTRMIRNITDIGPPTPASEAPSFTFEVVQRAPAYGANAFLVTKFQVNAPFDAQPLPPQVENSAGTPRVRPPDSGMMLMRTELVDAAGAPIPKYKPFEPVGGIMVLPLDVKPGEKFGSTGADPRTGKVVRTQGAVGNKARINACGEPVDGYVVRLAVNVSDNLDSDGDGATATGYVWKYVIAPQYGGLMLQEATEVNPGAGTRGPQGCIGEQNLPDVPVTTTSSLPPETPTVPDTTPRTCAPQDYIVPPDTTPREETLYNIGFLAPAPEVPLAELP